ncbi:MAG: acetyl-CoA carboxylase biotin carboxylase subunit [Bacteroidetes bacterium]|nr:acetyl-CoA carboxylase biotin carboxylase subunit [Bacteroidota bacterium]
MFKKILIANRGEIAVRIIRACREMGIKSAAIYSDADKTSLHTRLADEAHYMGESTASQSYLNKSKIIDLAKKIKADAIHPGYGFFSENSDFIKTLEDEKITFIGPSSKSVSMMGNKTAARELMSKSGVPIVPGTTKPISSVDEGIDSAKQIGFPVLLKAAAGGGGKGMRKISSVQEFKDAFEATKREAMKSFGDDSIYIEKYIENPRHIEVQVIADKHGNYAHLFERECSIQRRHQKIIEEAPSSFIDSETRNKITQAAVNAAKACGYFNAGTIEFLMDSKKTFYFLEMNTRLQVEHPVTELISGIDLVKEQINIALGHKLSFKQEDLKIIGHAIESRIYAEDPANNFLPATGIISEYKIPSGPGVRVDDGFGTGSEISVYYDPLISKLIVWAKDRTSAIHRMNRALSEYQITGLINNISFLKSIFSDEKFIHGQIDINFLEREIGHIIESSNENNILFEDAAAIISALLKEKALVRKKEDSYYSPLKNDNNNWSSLQYD